MDYDTLFAHGIDTHEQEFVNKADDHFRPRISRGDLYDMFYDWAEEKMREPGFFKPRQIPTTKSPPLKSRIHLPLFTAFRKQEKTFWSLCRTVL